MGVKAVLAGLFLPLFVPLLLMVPLADGTVSKCLAPGEPDVKCQAGKDLFCFTLKCRDNDLNGCSGGTNLFNRELACMLLRSECLKYDSGPMLEGKDACQICGTDKCNTGQLSDGGDWNGQKDGGGSGGGGSREGGSRVSKCYSGEGNTEVFECSEKSGTEFCWKLMCERGGDVQPLGGCGSSEIGRDAWCKALICVGGTKLPDPEGCNTCTTDLCNAGNKAPGNWVLLLVAASLLVWLRQHAIA